MTRMSRILRESERDFGQHQFRLVGDGAETQKQSHLPYR